MSSTPVLLSILIPTLVSRQALFARLHAEIERQVGQAAAHAAVEILSAVDDGTESVGAKRNRLLARASGRFTVFIDDDDHISQDYIHRVLRAIHDHPTADCISYAGEVRFRGAHPRRLVHSIVYRDWGALNGQYCRPPCHITPIRRDIAVSYRFAEVDYAEDMDWTLRICRDGALREEVLIDQVLYHYDSRRPYLWQWLLDVTQPARHALGLRRVRHPGFRSGPGSLPDHSRSGKWPGR